MKNAKRLAKLIVASLVSCIFIFIGNAATHASSSPITGLRAVSATPDYKPLGIPISIPVRINVGTGVFQSYQISLAFDSSRIDILSAEQSPESIAYHGYIITNPLLSLLQVNSDSEQYQVAFENLTKAKNTAMIGAIPLAPDISFTGIVTLCNLKLIGKVKGPAKISVSYFSTGLYALESPQISPLPILNNIYLEFQ